MFEFIYQILSASPVNLALLCVILLIIKDIKRT